jgi:maleylpyruvate isomerase
MTNDDATAVLHGYYRSSAAFRLRIALNFKQISYSTIAHHLRRGEQRSAAYLALNPQGLVPTLELDGQILAQSLATIDYLDETRPLPPLLPAKAPDRARVRAIAQIIACDIHPIDNLRVLTYLRDELGQPKEQVSRWYAHWIVQGFDALEPMLAHDPRTGRFCHGDMPGLGDICLVPQVTNARLQNVDISRYPTITRIADEALTIAAFADALPGNQPDAE